jgi:hypothetical protein
MKRRGKRETFVCPHCGADVAVGAASCRECGSDAETGWSQDADVWEAGIPAGYGSDDDFDYDEFIEQELPEKRTINAGRELSRWGWRALIAIVCLALLRYLWR